MVDSFQFNEPEGFPVQLETANNHRDLAAPYQLHRFMGDMTLTHNARIMPIPKNRKSDCESVAFMPRDSMA
jgi:hypothetical protein